MSSNLPPGVTDAMIEETAGDERTLAEIFHKHEPIVSLTQRLVLRVRESHLEDVRRELRRQGFRFMGSHPLAYSDQLRVVAEREAGPHVLQALHRAATYMGSDNDANSAIDAGEADAIAQTLMQLTGGQDGTKLL